MIQVKYPKIECPEYEERYLNIFDISIIQKEWDKLRGNNIKLQQFPKSLKRILLADYRKLVNIYIKYKKIRNLLDDNSVIVEIEKIFNYDSWCDSIAMYFMDSKNGFHFSTCHYCNMAYVNAYDVDEEKDALFFLNTASDDELKNKLDTKSQKSINRYKQARPYTNEEDFNRVAESLRCKPDKFDRTFRKEIAMRRQFDIDHVLPKSICPLVALSLYNFVPSCQVCNSKLKKTRVLGKYGVPNLKLSPTSDMYEFENKVKFRLLPKTVCDFSSSLTDKKEQYQLDLDTSSDSDYEYNVALFKLRERYDYHKSEALHWLEIKNRYTDARIKMIAKVLNFNFNKIKEDIFQFALDESYHRVFAKMKKDILG